MVSTSKYDHVRRYTFWHQGMVDCVSSYPSIQVLLKSMLVVVLLTPTSNLRGELPSNGDI